MNKRKLKLFLKIFFLLLAIQAVIVLIHILFDKGGDTITAITSFLITIISLPISFISSNLPFYSGEGILVTLMFWVLNVVLQTMVVYAFFRIKKKMK